MIRHIPIKSQIATCLVALGAARVMVAFRLKRGQRRGYFLCDEEQGTAVSALRVIWDLDLLFQLNSSLILLKMELRSVFSVVALSEKVC